MDRFLLVIPVPEASDPLQQVAHPYSEYAAAHAYAAYLRANGLTAHVVKASRPTTRLSTPIARASGGSQTQGAKP